MKNAWLSTMYYGTFYKNFRAMRQMEDKLLQFAQYFFAVATTTTRFAPNIMCEINCNKLLSFVNNSFFYVSSTYPRMDFRKPVILSVASYFAKFDEFCFR